MWKLVSNLMCIVSMLPRTKVSRLVACNASMLPSIEVSMVLSIEFSTLVTCLTNMFL